MVLAINRGVNMSFYGNIINRIDDFNIFKGLLKVLKIQETDNKIEYRLTFNEEKEDTILTITYSQDEETLEIY